MPAATRRIVSLVLLCGWALSMMLTVNIMGPEPGNRFPGWLVLAIGWMGALAFQFGWYANLLIVPALAIDLLAPPVRPERSRRRGIVAGGIALLGIDALFWRQMWGDNGTAPIRSFGAGYYLWFAVLTGTVASLMIRGPRGAMP